jgi:hypothetical protein
VVLNNGRQLRLESNLGRVIDESEAKENAEFLKRLNNSFRFDLPGISLWVESDGVTIRVHQDVEPCLFVEMTIPKDTTKPVEFRTTEEAIMYSNLEVI